MPARGKNKGQQIDVLALGENVVILAQAFEPEEIQIISTTVGFGEKDSIDFYGEINFGGQLVRLLKQSFL